MKTSARWAKWIGFAAAVVLCGVAGDAQAALVTISGAETWDGVANPHAADGVTLSSGVYTIPNGMTINAAGSIGLGPTNLNNVTLSFATNGGGLTLDGTINLSAGVRNGPYVQRTFTLAMNNNIITGTGDMIATYITNSTPSRHALSITGTGNVSFDDINFLHSDGGIAGDVNINVGGSVTLDQIDTSDEAAGGDAAENVTIRASAVTVRTISAYASRPGSAVNNGNVTIEALGYPWFDPSDSTANTMSNTVTLNGRIDVEDSAQNQGGGNVTIRGVVVTLNASFTVDKEADSTLSIYAGQEPPFTGLHFFDSSTDPTNYSATLNVAYQVGAKRRYTEPFDSAASATANGWTNVASTNDGNSFGFTNTAAVSGSAGEAGGIFARSSTLHYYADTTLGDGFTRQDTFSLSGSMRLVNDDFDGAAFIGFFDTRDLTPPTSFIGLFISEPAGPAGDPFRVSARVQNAAGSPAEAGSSLIPIAQNTTVTFTLMWTGLPDGSGTLAGTINGTSVSVSQGAAVGAFNAFGIGAGFTGANPAQNTGNCLFDNLSYGAPAGPAGTVIYIQ